jgi:hypothetical protein
MSRRSKMKTIYKYELKMKDFQHLLLPAEAEILTVQAQGNTPCIWAKVNTESPLEERCFEMFGTGINIPSGMGVSRKYINSFQLFGGSLVFHLFERL